MSSRANIKNPLLLRVLAELGNDHPKPHQLRLIEELLLQTNFQHSIFFHNKLSEGERNCLLLAAKGKTIQQTAYLLAVKNSTVTTLRKRALNKLKCRSMAHAVFIGMHYGCFSQDYKIASPEEEQ